MKGTLIVCVALAVASTAGAAVTSSTSHGDKDFVGLAQPIAAGDLLSGLIGSEQAGDIGWHGVNTAAEDQLPAFTDDHGPNGRPFYGLLNDPFNGGLGSDQPVKLVRYDLGGPKNITELRIFTGNINGADGRIFSTTVVKYSTDGGNIFQDLGYFQSDPSGTINNALAGNFFTTLVRIFDDQSPTLLSGVTHLQFNFYAVHRNNDTMHDPFDGVNPFTGGNDNLASPFTSPLVYEIDALPEPGTLALLGLGGLLIRGRRRRT
ncbi:MAG: PEP-CTERM sorting domain-containing protein [Phycisphaerae bacterium]|jgi:hypothetical protein